MKLSWHCCVEQPQSGYCSCTLDIISCHVSLSMPQCNIFKTFETLTRTHEIDRWGTRVSKRTSRVCTAWTRPSGPRGKMGTRNAWRLPELCIRKQVCDRQALCDSWCKMQDLCDKTLSAIMPSDACFTECIENEGRTLVS